MGMTNEETLDYFKKCNENLVSVAKDENVYNYEKKEIEADCMREAFEANEKAIQALEQQPNYLEQIKWERDIAIGQLEQLGYSLGEKIKTDGDCISKQAVNELVDELARTIGDERCGVTIRKSSKEIMQDIIDLPPVTPSRPKGKWIGDESLDGSIRYMCSNCTEFECVDYYNFCPNCGADMRESEEQ